MEWDSLFFFFCRWGRRLYNPLSYKMHDSTVSSCNRPRCPLCSQVVVQEGEPGTTPHNISVKIEKSIGTVELRKTILRDNARQTRMWYLV